MRSIDISDAASTCMIEDAVCFRLNHQTVLKWHSSGVLWSCKSFSITLWLKNVCSTPVLWLYRIKWVVLYFKSNAALKLLIFELAFECDDNFNFDFWEKIDNFGNCPLFCCSNVCIFIKNTLFCFTSYCLNVDFAAPSFFLQSRMSNLLVTQLKVKMFSYCF